MSLDYFSRFVNNIPGKSRGQKFIIAQWASSADITIIIYVVSAEENILLIYKTNDLRK